ncbi:DUF1697 domain-containing protein [Streptomyces sp. RB6PN25]|uniref:DUF1697 domain-containing protein n=1 Tax=Streptomyces humicola TaxID=2953240 RepID=A0ABT1PWI4_9ACTN|nr:DUF1697 domain-containing protein [Streptomyces humicola]MCQ4082033.1 DUF1697 domain-containing protein [Streptomyces humicola]
MSADQTHIAFLRAVNVGGRKVEMARLREVLAGLGLGSVRTYIASGNAFFTSAETDRTALVERIEHALADSFGFAIPTILRTVPELEAELAASPFVGREPAEDERFSMVFTSGSLAGGEFPMRSAKGDWEILGASERTAYVIWRRLNGRPGANPNPVIEKTFGVYATGRFFHTAEKILAASRKA